MHMNQLQTLLHDALIATGHVKQCAIIRRKDTTLRASSVGFHPSFDNMHAIANAFGNPAGSRKEGLKFEEVVYECVRADKFSLYGKHENSGIVVVKTATLFVVGLYSNEMSPSICVEAVEKLETIVASCLLEFAFSMPPVKNIRADYFREKAK